MPPPLVQTDKLPEVCQKAVCTLIRYEQPLALLGLYYLWNTLFHTLLSFLSGFRYYVLAQWFPVNLRCYGQWAVVNLAENTISYHYAEELARKRMDILLIGHQEDADDLKAFAERLQSKFNVTIRVLTLGDNSAEMLECIDNELEALGNIGVLVNQLPFRPQFAPHTLMTECNFIGPIQFLAQTNYITKAVARMMMERGGGAIVNIGDPSGEYPHPYMSSYSAAASYMDLFSRSLRRELSCHNISVQSLVLYPSIHVPGECSSILGPSSHTIAKHAVNMLGKERSRGYWWYAVKGYVASWFPLCLRQYWRGFISRPKGACQLAIE